MEREDLRITKTRKAIKETFLAMRREMPLEKIHVRELCKRALINKSTFYNHFEDVYALSDEMEDEAIKEFLNRFHAKDCLLSEPQRFLSEMPLAFDANMMLLQPLFKGRYDEAFLKLEKELKRLYEHPGMTPKEDIRLTFLLNGTLHTLKEMRFDKKYDDELLASTISELICTEESKKDCSLRNRQERQAPIAE